MRWKCQEKFAISPHLVSDWEWEKYRHSDNDESFFLFLKFITHIWKNLCERGWKRKISFTLYLPPPCSRRRVMISLSYHVSRREISFHYNSLHIVIIIVVSSHCQPSFRAQNTALLLTFHLSHHPHTRSIFPCPPRCLSNIKLIFIKRINSIFLFHLRFWSQVCNFEHKCHRFFHRHTRALHYACHLVQRKKNIISQKI